jgi:SAM-dependent methyltransferase
MTMRTHSVPRCPVCGSGGDTAFQGLIDLLFGAPGQWSMRRCRGCGSLWLDPAPALESLGEAYADYYTHRPVKEGEQPWWDRPSVKRLAAGRLGYPAVSMSGWRSAVDFLLPHRVELALFSRLYLPFVADGRLLDVGCGAGEQLAMMRSAGWQARGLDVDAAAVRAARSRGFDVFEGDLLAAPFAESAFDAITMIHVVEHLIRPQDHFAAARRLLAPGGRLVIVTPNAASLGARWFGSAWRGLEPPRHIQVFTPAGLRSLLQHAGFEVERLRTSARSAASLWSISAALRAAAGGVRHVDQEAVRPSFLHRLLELAAHVACRGGSLSGDEIVAVAVRGQSRADAKAEVAA